MRPLTIFRHINCEGPAYLAEVLERHAIPWRLIRVDKGESIPDTFDDCSGLVFMGGPMSVNDPLPWIEQDNFNPNYLMRDIDRLPQRGAKPEWQHNQDYWHERDEIPVTDLDGAEFVYDGKRRRDARGAQNANKRDSTDVSTEAGGS